MYLSAELMWEESEPASSALVRRAVSGWFDMSAVHITYRTSPFWVSRAITGATPRSKVCFTSRKTPEQYSFFSREDGIVSTSWWHYRTVECCRLNSNWWSGIILEDPSLGRICFSRILPRIGELPRLKNFIIIKSTLFFEQCMHQQFWNKKDP